jgi:beta-exotoxin I transport system permease protein
MASGYLTGSVFEKSLRDQLIAVLSWGLGLGAVAWGSMLFYPSVAEQFQAYDELLNAMPIVSSFLGGVATLGTLEGYIVYGLLSYVPLALGFYAVLAAIGTIGGEIESGTMDFLLMHPVPRWRVVVEKVAALVLSLSLIGLLLGLGMWVGGLGIASSVSAERWLAAGLNVVPLCLLYAALAFAVSCAVRGRQAALGVGIGVLLLSFVANGLVPLVKSLEPYRELSLYYLYAASKPLSTGVRLDHVAILLGASAFLFAVGVAAFQRRDLVA